jgi:hypothetical protein
VAAAYYSAYLLLTPTSPTTYYCGGWLVLKLVVLKLCGISNDEFFQNHKQNVLKQWHLQ